jgi:DNA polymerase III delta' subunit
MAFQDIAGNSRVRKILRLALQRARVPNSLLFFGPRGVGKKATAFELAKALNCLRRTDDACDGCASCLAVDRKDKETGRRQHPDVIEIGVAKDKTAIAIEQMREMKSLAYLMPLTGRRRIFIIDGAETMSEEAANSVLKVLEEPPLFTHIILLSDNPALILPTIKSRCQVLPFLPVADEEIERALRKSGVEADKARLMALIVRGDLERALHLDWKNIEANRREAWTLFRAIVRSEDPAAFLRRFGTGRRKDIREELERTLEMFSAFGRDLALLGEGGDPGLLLNPDYEDELRDCASSVTAERALKIIGLVHGAAASLDRNVNIGALTASLTARWLRVMEAI